MGVDQRLIASLLRLEDMQDRLEAAIFGRIDQAIRDAEHLAHQVTLCPDCGARMTREQALVSCPQCGLCLSDSDAPTAELPPVSVEQSP